MSFFRTGKLPPDFLEKLLKRIDPQDPDLVVGPRVGEDAAVIDMGDKYLVAKTDPVTFVEREIGWYCVNINANDVATMGAKPRWFLSTLLLPEGKTDEAFVEKIFDDINESCNNLGITLCGGHTEVTAGLDKPILVGQMLGEVSKNKLVRSDRIEVGDSVLLTQGIAIEGTAILAAEKEKILSEKTNADIISRAKKFLVNPGISVVEAALTASQIADVHWMHDPTEGGIATGLWELGKVSGLGLRINGDQVIVFPETKVFCEALGLNPWGLIASGALLIVVNSEDADKVISSLSQRNIPTVTIGQVTPPEEGLTFSLGGKVFPLVPFVNDELTRVVE